MEDGGWRFEESGESVKSFYNKVSEKGLWKPRGLLGSFKGTLEVSGHDFKGSSSAWLFVASVNNI